MNVFGGGITITSVFSVRAIGIFLSPLRKSNRIHLCQSLIATTDGLLESQQNIYLSFLDLVLKALGTCSLVVFFQAAVFY